MSSWDIVDLLSFARLAGAGRRCAAVACTLIAGCSATVGPTGTSTANLDWQMDSELYRASGAGANAEVRYEYPRFDTGQTRPGLAAALNAWVVHRLACEACTEHAHPNPDSAARAFLDAFERETAHLPDEVGIDWFDAHSIRVIHDTDHLISLAHNRSWHTGGAHPNSTRALASFDLESGDELTLDTILRDGVETRLASLQTRALRRAHELPADADLADAGFITDDDGHVPLSRNFAVVADGWLFHWDPYEIAPYAMGPTEITLGWREIANLVRRGSPAAPPDPPKVAEDEDDA